MTQELDFRTALDDLQAGRLSQKCGSCDLVEAAGYYCSACAKPTGPGRWFKATKSSTKTSQSKGQA